MLNSYGDFPWAIIRGTWDFTAFWSRARPLLTYFFYSTGTNSLPTLRHLFPLNCRFGLYTHTDITLWKTALHTCSYIIEIIALHKQMRFQRHWYFHYILVTYHKVSDHSFQRSEIQFQFSAWYVKTHMLWTILAFFGN